MQKRGQTVCTRFLILLISKCKFVTTSRDGSLSILFVLSFDMIIFCHHPSKACLQLVSTLSPLCHQLTPIDSTWLPIIFQKCPIKFFLGSPASICLHRVSTLPPMTSFGLHFVRIKFLFGLLFGLQIFLDKRAPQQIYGVFRKYLEKRSSGSACLPV